MLKYNIIQNKSEWGCIIQHTLLFIEQSLPTKADFYILYNTRIVNIFFHYFHLLPAGVRIKFVPKVF